LILDGLDSSKNATEWYDMFPKAKWGQILVTTRNSDALLKFAAGFTDSKDKMIMAVPELDLKDARRLFDSYLSDPQQDSLLAVSDEDFQELLSVVKIPLFVRLAASYLLRYKGGNISLRELVMKLKTNISSIRRLGPLDAVHPKSDIDQMEEKLYNVFAVLLFPFVQEHNPCDSEEFELLGILSCFSCDFLHFEILKAFYPKDILGLKEMLGLYCRHGFITHCGNGQYTMHGLISEFVRQYMMENQQLGPIRVMNCFRYALDRIFEMYLHDKKTKYQKENGRIQRDSYLWKVDYMPHFEEFLTYIKKLKRVEEAALRLDTWKFGVYTAQSILTFSRTLATGNRDDDAILLLEFVVDRGIEETKGRAEALKVKIDILLSLATRLFDRRSGRRQDEYLQKAEKYARKGLKSAREQNLPGRIWRLWLILLRILMKLKLLPQAQEELSHLQTELETDHWNLDSEEKTKLAFRLQVEEGTLQLLDGLSKRLKSMIISSRSFFLELVEKVEIDMREEKDVILDTRKRLAEVDLVIPMDGPLEEAQIIYAGILKSKQEQFSNHSEHPEIARAQLNLWMAQLRRAQLQQGQLRSGPIEQAKNDLERLLAILKQKFGQKDGLTRDVAYALRVALELSDDWTGADTLKTEFDMLEKTEGGFWFDRENDPDPSDPWPAEWETPLKARSFLGRSIYLFASGSGMNRWPNMNAGLQRMLDEGLVFESNFDSDVD
jgi:tetratricopeptide (TPR) repeat protein